MNDQRDEALRLANQALQETDWAERSVPFEKFCENAITSGVVQFYERLIALARASAAPQEPYCPNCNCTYCAEISLAKFDEDVGTTPQPQAPSQEPDPSDELAWYKWAHKELGRRNTKLAEENFQYWQKERDAAPQPQAPSSDDLRDKRIAELEAKIHTLTNRADMRRKYLRRLEAALADARNSALEEAAAAMDATCASGKAQHSDMIRALRTTSEK